MATKTAKARAKHQASAKKTEEARVPKLKPICEVRVGDRLVNNTNKQGYVTSSTLVQKIVTGEGCRNFHVNGTACYDRSLPVLVAVSLDEANLDAIDEIIAAMEES